MAFIPKTPYLTTDGIIEIYDQNEIFQGIVLITRKNPPFGFALPGGFVDVGEKIEDALKREMKEEVSLDVDIQYLLNVYSDPNRDSRFHTASVVYVCKAYTTPIAADDAKEAMIVKTDKLKSMKFAFDHGKIIDDYIKKEVVGSE